MELFWKSLGVVAYLLVLLGIGAVASRRMRDLRDFFVAGKGLGYWAAAFSARATGESAWLLLGLTGMGATLGMRAFLVVLGEVVGVGAAWLLMAGRFKRLTDRYDAITVPDYLEARLRDKAQILRRVSAAALVAFVVIYVSAQIDATGTAFESFLGGNYLGGLVPVNYWTGAAVGFLVVMAYSISGGFVAVVWSDVFQGTLMVLGLVALPIVAIASLGGPPVLFERLSDIDHTLLRFGGPDGWTGTSIAGGIGLVLIGLGFLGSPQIFVRFLALRSPREIPRGTAVALVWTVLADGGAVLIGMAGRAILTRPGDDPIAILGNGGQGVVPALLDHLHTVGWMPALAIGLYIAIVLAAIMSTVDSLLVVASSAIVRDVYQRIVDPDARDDQLVSMSRSATLVLGLAAFVLSMSVAMLVEERTIFWFVIFGWSGIAATFCPVMILTLYWGGVTVRGALGGMVSGFLAVPLFKFGAPLLAQIGAGGVLPPTAAFAPAGTGLASVGHLGQWLVALGELPPAFLTGLVVIVVVSLLDGEGRILVRAATKEIAEAA